MQETDIIILELINEGFTDEEIVEILLEFEGRLDEIKNDCNIYFRRLAIILMRGLANGQISDFVNTIASISAIKQFLKQNTIEVYDERLYKQIQTIIMHLIGCGVPNINKVFKKAF